MTRDRSTCWICVLSDLESGPVCVLRCAMPRRESGNDHCEALLGGGHELTALQAC